MKIAYSVILWPFSMILLSDESQASQTEVRFNFTGQNHSSVPADINKGVTILDLSYNQVTLDARDTKVLQMYVLLKELYLIKNNVIILQNNSFGNLSNLEILNICRNAISVIQRGAFVGLNKLKQLHLCQNNITQLEPGTFVPLTNLVLLNLQGNLISSLEVPQAFHLELITSDGNLWNCSCRLFNLKNWLNTSKVTLEHENITMCSTPDLSRSYSIKTVPYQVECCLKFSSVATENLYKNFMSVSNSTFNSPLNSTTNPEQERIGKSWAFLVGVIVTVLVTSLLIFIAIKCPTWYNLLLSYKHHRLEEHDAENYEDGLTGNMSYLPQTPEEETTVIFEQLHSFVIDDDGFIEDKYIDTHELQKEN
ncbi:leucine-rich repeat-containing protein 19 [Tenrec ecaudatus]|uniref:leucine-rich repeat-containing protein 19 n=1 Tax=Tenrec ecaudatus TaxID=94439 RepID=UPI003F5933D2